MRIISGCRRGHKLLEFEGRGVRPTTDRVKESIFNLIQDHIPGAEILDMFAGSGALSFEAVSRGAAHAVLLDNDSRSIELIRKNVSGLGFEDKCTVTQKSCFDYLKQRGKKYDIIFLDPPYNKGYIEPALTAIVSNDALSDEGIIVLESDNTDFRSDIEGLGIYRQRKYGRTFITIYRKM